MADYPVANPAAQDSSPKEGRPPGQIGRLTNITAQFDEAIERLSSRLSAVLIGEMASPVLPGSDARNPNQSELEALLDALHDRVVQIRSITDRVDL